MKNLVVLLEERSAKELLCGVLPRVLPVGCQVCYLVFEGKQDLEKNIRVKLRAWQDPHAVFLIVRDQDRGSCHAVKEALAQKCTASGKKMWKVRVACHEVEAWLLGDLAALEVALERPGLARLQERKKYRNPDALQKPSLELARLTQGNYQKVSGCRAAGPHLSITRTRSKSFASTLAAARILVESK